MDDALRVLRGSHTAQRREEHLSSEQATGERKKCRPPVTMVGSTPGIAPWNRPL